MGAQVPLRAAPALEVRDVRLGQAPLLEVGHVGPSGRPWSGGGGGDRAGAAGAGVAGDGVQLALVVDALGEAPLPQQPGAVQAPVQGGLVEVELAHPGHAVAAVAQGLVVGGLLEGVVGAVAGDAAAVVLPAGSEAGAGRGAEGRRADGAGESHPPRGDLRQVGHAQGEGRQPRGLPGHPIRPVLIREEEEDVRPLGRGLASGPVWGAWGCSHGKDRRRSIEPGRRRRPTLAPRPRRGGQRGRARSIRSWTRVLGRPATRCRDGELRCVPSPPRAVGVGRAGDGDAVAGFRRTPRTGRGPARCVGGRRGRTFAGPAACDLAPCAHRHVERSAGRPRTSSGQEGQEGIGR